MAKTWQKGKATLAAPRAPCSPAHRPSHRVSQHLTFLLSQSFDCHRNSLTVNFLLNSNHPTSSYFCVIFCLRLSAASRESSHQQRNSTQQQPWPIQQQQAQSQRRSPGRWLPSLPAWCRCVEGSAFVCWRSLCAYATTFGVTRTVGRRGQHAFCCCVQIAFCIVCVAVAANWSKIWWQYRSKSWQVYIMLESVNLAIFAGVTGAFVAAFFLLARRVTPVVAK